MEKDVKEVEEVKEVKEDNVAELPQGEKKEQIVIGLMPAYTPHFLQVAWEKVKPFVEEIIEQTKEPYSAMSVWQDIYYGRSFLYMGYIVEDVIEYKAEDYQMVASNCLMGAVENKFAGYFIVKLEEENMHVWQAYIPQEYRKSKIFLRGLEYVEGEANKMGAPALTFSSNIENWDKTAPNMGFEKILSVYKKVLK